MAKYFAFLSSLALSDSAECYLINNKLVVSWWFGALRCFRGRRTIAVAVRLRTVMLKLFMSLQHWNRTARTDRTEELFLGAGLTSIPAFVGVEHCFAETTSFGFDVDELFALCWSILYSSEHMCIEVGVGAHVGFIILWTWVLHLMMTCYRSMPMLQSGSVDGTVACQPITCLPSSMGCPE